MLIERKAMNIIPLDATVVHFMDHADPFMEPLHHPAVFLKSSCVPAGSCRGDYIHEPQGNDLCICLEVSNQDSVPLCYTIS